MEDNHQSNENASENLTFSTILYNNLKEAKYEEALNILKASENEFYLKHNSLEIVPIVSSILQEEFCTHDTELCIEKILEYIASIANSKEALLVFLEEIEIFRSKKQIRVMLKPLQVVLLQQVSTEAKSYAFSWSFNTLNTHISVLPLPSENNLEGKERKLMDADSEYQNLVDILDNALNFYLAFYEQILNKKLAWRDKTITSEEYFSIFLLKLFHKPLAYLDIYKEEKDAESRLYCICSNLVDMISTLLCNPLKLLAYIKPKSKENGKSIDKTTQQQQISDDEEHEEQVGQISQQSLATFFYCIFGQKICAFKLPCVYSHVHLYLSCLPCCLYLLMEKETFAIHKGLILFKALLQNLPKNSLQQDCLEVPNHLDIFRSLVQVMTLCESKECRVLALETMKLWFRKFNSNGRFYLFSLALSTISHSGILGVIIHELKENIRISLSNAQSLDSNFTGQKLQSILCLACSLPNGEKTDLLEWSDKIMGALNLLLFICLCDTQNRSCFKPVLPKISEEFLQPLENGLRLSKGHYELKLKDLQENKKREFSEVEVNVNGESTSGIVAEKEKEMVVQALNWFDTIQSVWARVNKQVNLAINLKS